MNLINRPYDIVIPGNVLPSIVQRRKSPDGKVHPVKEVMRGGVRSYQYPWDKMELGDFFIVPVGNRSPHSMTISFYQAAARRDIEIAVTKWTMPDGSPGFRVCVVIIGVTRYKVMLDRLLDEDENLPLEEQKHQDVPRPRYSDIAKRTKSTRKAVKKSRSKSRLKSRNLPRGHHHPDLVKDNFWADDKPLPIDVAINNLTPAPEVKLSRAEIIARALGVSPD